MNALLLHHVALHSPSPPRTTTPFPSPIVIVTRNPKPLRAQGRGFGSGSGAGAGAAISHAKKGEIKIKRQDDDGEDEDEDEDEIPQVVFERMLRRIAVAVGAPMAAGVGTVCALAALKRGGAWAAPAWVPFVASLLAFGTSAFGIAYGTLSASWDPDREGSPLGWEEARTNWTQLWNDHDEAQNTTTS